MTPAALFHKLQGKMLQFAVSKTASNLGKDKNKHIK